jgi:hypothetical protein
MILFQTVFVALLLLAMVGLGFFLFMLWISGRHGD